MKHISTKAAIVAASFFLATSAFAQTGETPAALEGAKTVSASEAKSLLDKGAMPLDVRRRAAYVEGRLPKAKSISSLQDSSSKEFAPEAFGPKKDAPLLVYGHGSDGWSAVSAVNGAVKLGYTNVHWLRGGWTEWSKAGLPTEQ